MFKTAAWREGGTEEEDDLYLILKQPMEKAEPFLSNYI
jgi:hypothetical protein